MRVKIITMQNNPDRENMFVLIEQWKSSGLSQKAFCEQHEVRYHVFHYWYKRYRRQHQKPVDNTSAFIPLQINSSSSGGCAELILPDGRRLLFHQAVDANFLKTLLA